MAVLSEGLKAAFEAWESFMEAREEICMVASFFQF
jgi:hypothetical protein